MKNLLKELFSTDEYYICCHCIDEKKCSRCACLFMVETYQVSQNDKDVWIMDSGSGGHIKTNKDNATNIREEEFILQTQSDQREWFMISKVMKMEKW